MESPLTAFAGEQLEVDYQVHELPDDIILTKLLRKPLLGHQYLLRKIKAWLVNLKVKDLLLVFLQLLSHDTPYLDIFPVYQLKKK